MSRWLALPTVLLLAPVAAAQIPAPWDTPPGYGLTWGPTARFPVRPLPPVRPRPPHWQPGIGFGLGVGYAPIGVAAPVLYPGWGGYYGGYNGGYYGGYYGGAGGPTVVVENFGKTKAVGTLRVTRTYSNQTEPLADTEVELEPGKNVFTFSHKIEMPAGYTYRADFVPKDDKADVLIQNNTTLIGSTLHQQVGKYEPHPDEAPIRLQDHGNPVRFRNIWVRKL